MFYVILVVFALSILTVIAAPFMWLKILGGIVAGVIAVVIGLIYWAISTLRAHSE